VKDYKPLLRISEPKAHENLIAYLLRLTEYNDYDKLVWILEFAGLDSNLHNSLSLFFDSGQSLSKLSKLTSIDEAKLRSLQYPLIKTSLGARSCIFFDSQIHRYMLSMRAPKICPSCLGEFGYIPKIWDLAAVTVCERHKCLLVDSCQGCKARIRWSRNKISVCPCDFDWRRTDLQKVEDGDLKVVQQINQLCGISPAHHIEDRVQQLNPLHELDLSSYLTALFFIIGQLKGVNGTTGHRISFSALNSELHDLIIKAVKVFDNWPNGFYKFLEWRQVTWGNLGGKGVSDQFGAFYTLLTKELSSSCFDFMREAFDYYLREIWNGRYLPGRQARKFGPLIGKKYVIESAAGKYLGVESSRLRRLIEYKVLDAVERERNGKKIYFVDRASLQNYKHQYQHSLGMPELVSMLGLSHASVEGLIKQGMLVPFNGPAVTGSGVWRVRQEVVAKLIDDIEKKTTSNRKKCSHKHCRIDDAMRVIARLGVDKVFLVKAMLTGEITPCCLIKSKQGFFGQLRFIKEQISGYISIQMQDKKVGALYLQEAACELGIKKETASFLKEAGIIKVERSGKGIWNGFLISRESIENFKSLYVTAGELAHETGTNVSLAVRLLVEQEILPIAGPSIGNCPQYIFKRSDMEARDIELSELLKEWRIRSITRDKRIKLKSEEVCELLKIDLSKLRRLVENGLLVPFIPRQHSCYIETFNGYSVLRYAQLFKGRDDLVSGPVAARMLSVSIGSLHNNLMRTGRLKPVELQEKYRFNYYKREDVEHLATLRKID
jgi:hypothetical protein